MSKLPKTKSIFFVCTEGMVTSIAGATALKKQLIHNNLFDVKVEHIQPKWIPKDAKIVVCHETLKEELEKVVPHAYFVTVSDFMHNPEYKALAEEMAELAA